MRTNNYKISDGEEAVDQMIRDVMVQFQGKPVFTPPQENHYCDMKVWAAELVRRFIRMRLKKAFTDARRNPDLGGYLHRQRIVQNV